MIEGYRRVTRWRDWAFSRLAARSFDHFGAHSTICLPVRVSGERHIGIGSNVYIGAGSWLQVIGDEHDGPAVIIGSGVKVSGSCVISAAQQVVIGDDALLARNVYIADHRHRFLDVPTPVNLQGIEDLAPVTIGSGTWLAQNTVVMPGVEIGDGTVIGANSVVTKSIGPYSVAVGAPARVVRTFAPSDELEPGQ